MHIVNTQNNPEPQEQEGVPFQLSMEPFPEGVKLHHTMGLVTTTIAIPAATFTQMCKHWAIYQKDLMNQHMTIGQVMKHPYGPHGPLN